MHYDPSGFGILSRILTSALEEISRQQLVALAVQGEATLKRRCPKADVIVARVASAEKARSEEKAMHSCKPGAPRPCDEAPAGPGGAASLDPEPDQVRRFDRHEARA